MKRFKKILYVNESTADQKSTMAHAVALAESNQAELAVLTVVRRPATALTPKQPASGSRDGETAGGLSDAPCQVIDPTLEAACRHLNIRMDERVGKTANEVIRAVLTNRYDLVIKPAENPSWTQKLFGGDDMDLLRKCPCPVWIMKPQEKSSYRQVLAAVDFDPKHLSVSAELNREIVQLSASLALSDFATLHFVHAWEGFAASTILSRGDVSLTGVASYVEQEQEQHRIGLQQLAEELRQWLGEKAYGYLSPRFHLPKGPARKVIPPLAAELGADLVVMGTVARAGISGLLIGNTAEAIIDQLSCSVLAVKPPGFKTSVKVRA
ncbi:MAG: universal stress protein [Desulfobacterales bacterium]|jgi:nucleotide-binding universal stress UspA family protein|nr:universal stress protein [Desulfobacteraceae bacterium]MDD3992733.1 universal stress protein [Desulfobacteraceae bacterium]MDY0313301.1 universal stress protein [Desulfobacterales bacterium]